MREREMREREREQEREEREMRERGGGGCSRSPLIKEGPTASWARGAPGRPLPARKPAAGGPGRRRHPTEKKGGVSGEAAPLP